MKNKLVKLFEQFDYIRNHFVSPRKILEKKFYLKLGYKLNLDNPVTFNEKLQWLKLNDKNPLYTKLVDKKAVKDYVRDKIGDKYIIPTIGVWNKFDDIDFSTLPTRFVLKCTHDSGGLVICNNKAQLNIKETKKKINKSMRLNYYYRGFEWPYKNVPKKIIAEKHLNDFIESEHLNNQVYHNPNDQKEILDYKFFCFNGIPKFFKIDIGRFSDHHANFYDLEFNLLSIAEKAYPPNLNYKFEPPVNFNKMIEIAKILSNEKKFIRIDLYNINGNVYFGEMTFYPANGFMQFTEEAADLEIGNLINLD